MWAEAGLDPPSYGLWAQHAIHCATPLPYGLAHNYVQLFRITCADCSSITHFEFSAAARANGMFVSPPPGYNPAKNTCRFGRCVFMLDGR